MRTLGMIDGFDICDCCGQYIGDCVCPSSDDTSYSDNEEEDLDE